MGLGRSFGANKKALTQRRSFNARKRQLRDIVDSEADFPVLNVDKQKEVETRMIVLEVGGRFLTSDTNIIAVPPTVLSTCPAGVEGCISPRDAVTPS